MNRGPGVSRRLALLLAAALVSPALLAQPAPETAFFANQRVLVVANATSPFSLALARRYAALRHVPAAHVLALDGVPGELAGAAPVSFADCTERILQPLAACLHDRARRDRRTPDQLRRHLPARGPDQADRAAGQVPDAVRARLLRRRLLAQ